MTNINFQNLEAQEQRLLNAVSKQFEIDIIAIIKETLKLAKHAHSGQERDGGPPYIIHPIRAAASLIDEVDIDRPEIIMAALLHDIVEDTEITLPQIQEKFGQKVADIVSGVTRPRPENETEEQKRQNKKEAIRKLSKAEQEVRLVKLADVLDNARSWQYLPESHPSRQKIPRWRDELEHYIPIAENTNPDLCNLLVHIQEQTKQLENSAQ